MSIMLFKTSRWISAKHQLVRKTLSSLPLALPASKVAHFKPSRCFYLAHRTASNNVNNNANLKTASTIQEKFNTVQELSDESVSNQDMIHVDEIQTAIGSKETDDADSFDFKDWREIKTDLSKLPQYYLMLCKPWHTGSAVFGMSAGYVMAPVIFDPATFVFSSLGTALMAASANACNQFQEVPWESQLASKKDGVVVSGYLTPFHAMNFSVACASVGMMCLSSGVNSSAAILGLTNWIFYSIQYTPMKRMYEANTRIRSLVVGLLPMMGWGACTGSSMAPGSLLIGAIAFSWHYAYFNAFSWMNRPEYSQAGYNMISVSNPSKCKGRTLKYCLITSGLCVAAPYIDLTTWTFVYTSLPLNAYLVYSGLQFVLRGDNDSAQKLYKFSLLYLPALMILMWISKKSSGQKIVKEKEKKKPINLAMT